MTRVQKNLVGLGALTGAVLTIGTVAYYGVQKPEEAKKAATERENQLFTFDVAKVQKVELQGGIVLEKAGTEWKVVAPVKTDADKNTVDAIVAKMGELKATRWQAVDNAARFGLERPLQTATVHLEGGETRTIALGATNNFDQSIYVRRGDEKRAALVESGARAPFDKSLLDLREKRVLVFEDKDVAKVAVSVKKEKGPATEYVLARQGDKWALEKPIAEKADETTANAIANALRNLRATRFVTEEATPGELKGVGLDKPRGRVVLTMAADNAQKVLELSEKMEGGAKKVYARRGEHGWLAEAPANVFDDLDKDLFALRDKTVVAFDREQIGKVEFTALDGAQIAVKREKKKKEGQTWEEEEFTLLAPREGPAKRFKVSSLLYTLASAKATAFVEEKPKSLAKYGLDRAKVAAFYDKDGKLVGKLLVGDKKDDKVYAMAEGGARVVTLEGRVLDEWPKSVDDFVEPPPAPPAPVAPDPSKG